MRVCIHSGRPRPHKPGWYHGTMVKLFTRPETGRDMSLQLTEHAPGREPSLPFLRQFLDEAQVGFIYRPAAQWCEGVGVDSLNALRMHGAEFYAQDFCCHLLSFTRARIEQTLAPPRASGETGSGAGLQELSSQTTSVGSSRPGSESLQSTRDSASSISVGARVDPLVKPNGDPRHAGSSVVPMATLDTTGDGLVDSVALDSTGDGQADMVQPMQFRGGHGATRAERVVESKLMMYPSDADIKRARRQTAMQQGDVGIDTTGDGLIDTVVLDTTGDGQIDTVRPLTFAPTTTRRSVHGDL